MTIDRDEIERCADALATTVIMKDLATGGDARLFDVLGSLIKQKTGCDEERASALAIRQCQMLAVHALSGNETGTTAAPIYQAEEAILEAAGLWFDACDANNPAEKPEATFELMRAVINLRRLGGGFVRNSTIDNTRV